MIDPTNPPVVEVNYTAKARVILPTVSAYTHYVDIYVHNDLDKVKLHAYIVDQHNWIVKGSTTVVDAREIWNLTGVQEMLD